jgi:hypothetical protein
MFHQAVSLPRGSAHDSPDSPHGHVEASLAMIHQLDLHAVISSQRCLEWDLVVTMIVQRLIDPCSKLATTRAWHTTTLAEERGVADAPQALQRWIIKERQERRGPRGHLFWERPALE